MDATNSITISLEEYGAIDDEIVLRAPSFRRMNDMKNALSKLLREVKVSGVKEPTMDMVPLGDYEIVTRMCYVQKAPFKPTLEGWLEYAERMDENEFGSAQRLWTAMEEAIRQIDSSSPFAASQGAETPSSES